jgi:uncharacterized protein YaiL (DUF2058 family)
MGSLQDALLQAGLADEKRNTDTAQRGKVSPKAGRSRSGSTAAVKKKKAGGKQSDLARAYQARRRAEAKDKEERKKQRVAAQEARRQRNLELDRIVRSQTLNRKDAETPRYFEHLGRIRRVLCTNEQREQLNRGEIGVVNLRGSYLLVDLDTLARYREVAPDLVPELGGHSEPEDDGSHYPPVPDDLVW